MISRSVAVGLLAAGCLTAAAGGSYVVGRQNAASAAVYAEPALAPTAPTPAAQPVTETETVVAPETPVPPAPVAPNEGPVTSPATPEPELERTPVPAPSVPERRHTRVAAATPRPAQTPPRTRETPEPLAAPAVPESEPLVSRTLPPEPPVVPVQERSSAAPESTEAASPRPADRDVDEVVIPTSSVIGLEVERTVTSEQARVEDRVDARVTRDVYAEGRLVVPAGSRVIGNVTVAERGGKVKERARLGVRFHTLVLGDGRQLPLRTDTVIREGHSAGAESSRKIGGAAIGGAVLGAIFGGGKGAAAGAAVGAAGGTAAVMAGGRNAATLASGSVITVRLTAPVSVEVER